MKYKVRLNNNEAVMKYDTSVGNCIKQLAVVAERFKSSTMFKHSWRLKTQVRIPAQDYDINRSELEITRCYSNIRAVGGSCSGYNIQLSIDAIVPRNWYKFVGNSSTYKA